MLTIPGVAELGLPAVHAAREIRVIVLPLETRTPSRSLTAESVRPARASTPAHAYCASREPPCQVLQQLMLRRAGSRGKFIE